MNVSGLIYLIILNLIGLILVVHSIWYGWEVVVQENLRMSPYIQFSLYIIKMIFGINSSKRYEDSWKKPKNIRTFAFFSIIAGTFGFSLLFFMFIYILATW